MAAPISRQDAIVASNNVNGQIRSEISTEPSRYSLTAGLIGNAYHNAPTMPPSTSSLSRAEAQEFVTSRKAPFDPDHGKASFSEKSYTMKAQPPSFPGFPAVRRIRTEPHQYKIHKQHQRQHRYQEEERQQIHHNVSAQTLPPIHEALGFAVFAPRPPIPPRGVPEVGDSKSPVNVPSSLELQQSQSQQEIHEHETPKPSAAAQNVTSDRQFREEVADYMDDVSPPPSPVPPSAPSTGRISAMPPLVSTTDIDVATSKSSAKVEEQKQRREELVMQQLEMFDTNKVFTDVSIPPSLQPVTQLALSHALERETH